MIVSALFSDEGEPSGAPVDDFITFHNETLPGVSCKSLVVGLFNPNNVIQGNINIKLG